MANLDRVKRQLLRDLVQQNVDLIHGRAFRRHRSRDLWRYATRIASLAVLSVALFGSSRLISTMGEPGTAVAAAMAPALAAVRPAPVAKQLEGPPLPPPEPVDAAVFPLAVRKIAIDAGHGGAATGTRTPQGVLEKDLTLDIARRLQRVLEKQSFEVFLTRQGDHHVSLAQRGALANRAGADIFVSIHVNWLENRRSRGVETYYLGPTDDPYLTRLAAAENRESGYSLADMRQLLERIYAGVRQEKSRKLAESVQDALFHSLDELSPEMEDRGVKAAPFIVLLATEMPAVLAEVSSLSNDEEARLLTKPLYRQYIAEALARGIGAYADGAFEAEAAAEKGI
jgi:N-acetylmuramoyl-L-alanine amidase